MKRDTRKKHNKIPMTDEEIKQWNIDNPLVLSIHDRDKSELTIFDIFCKATTKPQQP